MVTNHSVVTTEVSGGNATQFHGYFLIQSFEAERLKADTMPGVACQLLVCTDASQNHLQKSEESQRCDRGQEKK